MKLAIISTFKNISDLKAFIHLNNAFMMENKKYAHCYATLSVETVKDKVPIWMSLTSMKDNSYSEGWNNVIDIYFQEIKGYSKICFIGNGDKLLGKLSNLNIENNLVCVCNMYRDGEFLINKFNSQFLWIFSIGVWTPSILWPARFFITYRFPTEFKIASDIDLFLSHKEELNEVAYLNYSIVDMASGGISSNNKGIYEYYKIASKYYPKWLSYFAYLIKKIR